MSTRERWILYPLLFLTLGIVLRDKVFPQKDFKALEVTAPEVTANKVTAFGEVAAEKVRCARLECQVMTITGQSGTGRVRLGTQRGRGGWIELYGANGSKLVVAGADPTGKSGMIDTYNSDGVPQVQLRSNRSGGLVTTGGGDEKIWLVLGRIGENYGVFAESAELGRSMLLTLPWRFDTRPAPGPRPDDNSPGDQPPKAPPARSTPDS